MVLYGWCLCTFGLLVWVLDVYVGLTWFADCCGWLLFGLLVIS